MDATRTGFFRAVSVNSEASQVQRILVKARRHLVGQRRDTENAIQGFLASLGIRFPKGSGKLAARVRVALEERPDPAPMIEPLLASAAARWILKSSATSEVFKEGLGGCFVAKAFSGC